MANGDIAAGLGWVTNAGTDDRRNGWDRINYALDRIAEQRITLRDTVLPAINQPIFSARKGSTNVRTDRRAWTRVDGSDFAAPQINSGFTSWNGGQLTVAKTGVYRISGHVQFTASKYSAGIQVTRNSNAADTNVCIKGENAGIGASSTGLVRLVAGDVLQVFVSAKVSSDSTDWSDVEAGAHNLQVDVEWLRA